MTDDLSHSKRAEGAEHWHAVMHGRMSPELKNNTKQTRKAEAKVEARAATAAVQTRDLDVRNQLDFHAGEIEMGRLQARVWGRELPEPATKHRGYTEQDVADLKTRVAVDEAVSAKAVSAKSQPRGNTRSVQTISLPMQRRTEGYVR